MCRDLGNRTESQIVDDQEDRVRAKIEAFEAIKTNGLLLFFSLEGAIEKRGRPSTKPVLLL